MDDVLYHYGIKGMKWGVRRYQNADGTLTDAGKRRAAKQEAKAIRKDERNARKAVREDRKWAKKNRSLLSDEELNARINRLQKEKLLRNLTAEELNPGRHEAGKILKQVGTQALSTAVGSAVGSTASSLTTNLVTNRINNRYNPKPSTYDTMREKAEARQRLKDEGLLN